MTISMQYIAVQFYRIVLLYSVGIGKIQQMTICGTIPTFNITFSIDRSKKNVVKY